MEGEEEAKNTYTYKTVSWEIFKNPEVQFKIVFFNCIPFTSIARYLMAEFYLLRFLK